MIKIRMKRMGRLHKPFYRINAMDARSPRDGKVIEQLGSYDPLKKDVSAQVQLNAERIMYWLGQGAQASDTVRSLLIKNGIKVN